MNCGAFYIKFYFSSRVAATIILYLTLHYWGLRGGQCVPVLLTGTLRSGLVVTSQDFLPSEPQFSPPFLSFFSPFSLSLSFSLVLSLSLCFLDFFLDFPCREGGVIQPWGLSWLLGAGDVEPGPAAGCRELPVKVVGWLSRSATAASWLSQSRPLWLESLLTSDSGSKGRGISSSGSCILELSPAAWETEESFPLEELNFPLIGGAPLLIRCDILGFLLAKGSMKSAADLFWRTKKSLSFKTAMANN